MGRRQHQSDKSAPPPPCARPERGPLAQRAPSPRAVYITSKEWATLYGGKKTGAAKGRSHEFKRLPFDCCAITMTPFEHPVCNLAGVCFELLAIMPYLKKYGTGECVAPRLCPPPPHQRPQTPPPARSWRRAASSGCTSKSAQGAARAPLRGARLTRFAWQEQRWQISLSRHLQGCPASPAEVGGWLRPRRRRCLPRTPGSRRWRPRATFTRAAPARGRPVAPRASDAGHRYEAVESLNIKAKNWKDLLTDKPFTRSDLIHVQDPTDLEKHNLSRFHHIKVKRPRPRLPPRASSPALAAQPENFGRRWGQARLQPQDDQLGDAVDACQALRQRVGMEEAARQGADCAAAHQHAIHAH